MYTKRRSNPWAWCAVLALAAGLSAGAARADDDPPDRVARVSFLSGSVSFQPAGDDQWAEASLNRPLGTGDKVYTDKDSRVELEIGAADIRLDQGSTFNLLNLDDNTAQIELTEGTVNLHVRRVADGQSYEVDTPTLAFVVNQPGNYRIDIAPQGDSTMVTVFDGAGDVYGENNASYSVRAGNTYRFNDTALHDYEVLDLPRGDDFDQWCSTRNQRYEHSVSRQYVSEDVIGYADLDNSGSWSTAPEYGNVWYPNTVEADWAPYRSGHWSWIDPWGWTWVDSAAWGFAPFHYGRWAYVDNRWGWCPGAYRGGRSIYAPALVAFVGGVGISVGGGGPVGWFPLGPREVYVPWYRASRGYFTNVNVRNTTFINNTYVTNVYNNNYSRGRPITGANYAYRGNMTAMSRDAFVGARPVAAGRVQINDRELRGAQVVSRVGIAPTQASFAGNAARGRAGPATGVMDRRVIARTAPPPRSAPIASRIQAIERNGAQPLAASQTRAIAARPGTSATQNRALASRVQLVGQNAAKPQPLPARGTASAAGQRPNIANDRASPAGPRGPVTPTNPANVGRAPVAAPGNTAPNAVQRGQSNATDRTALPSSRFAPRAGSPATGNNAGPAVTRGNPPAANAQNRALPNSVQRGSNVAPVERSNAQTPVPRQSLPQRTSPATDRGNTAAPQGQIRPAPQLREIPRNNSSVPQNQTRSVQQQQVQPRNVPQQPAQRSAPPQQQQQQQYQPRVEQRSVPQQQAQPRNVQPAQPRNVPPPQPQPRNQPAPQQREQRGERNKDKDKEGR
ncbi:MAG: DUF6600 domain-containing protein [Dokdonella sp.]